MTMGRWQVIGRREYRGHPTGTVFDANLADGPASRAIQRRDIVLLEHIEPGLPPEYTFPDGWLTAEQTDTKRGAGRRLSHSQERHKAHPAITDTSASTDTSGVGTRPVIGNHTSSEE